MEHLKVDKWRYGKTLTDRQRNIAQQLIDGYSIDEIADQLGVSRSTISRVQQTILALLTEKIDHDLRPNK